MTAEAWKPLGQGAFYLVCREADASHADMQSLVAWVTELFAGGMS